MAAESKEKDTSSVPGPAYKAVRTIYDQSPRRSWQRLNGALQNALTAAIEAHLPFGPDDFSLMHSRMSGGYWLGNSCGSQTGERFYTLAVQVGHTGACKSFESFAKRPPALWSEDVKTPSRLSIGSEFTWEGRKLTVTNLKEGHIVACLFDNDRSDVHGVTQVGTLEYFAGSYRRIEDYGVFHDGRIQVIYGAEKIGRESPRMKHIFRIKYEDIAAKRKAYDASVRRVLAELAGIQNQEQLNAFAQQFTSFTAELRHFDIEEVRGKFLETQQKLQAQMGEAERLAQWKAGEYIPSHFKDVFLRIRGGRVETSTGQSVRLESARRVLPWVLENRESDKTTSRPIDSYTIREFSPEGVLIGCTLIPWREVERFSALIA